MINWQLTEQQAEQLAAILDLACKAGGIEAAKVAVPLMDSLMAAVKRTTTLRNKQMATTITATAQDITGDFE